MKFVAPKSFTYEAGNQAVLLLHGFTGTTADVRKLGRHLHKMGYTVHAPLYRGHGVGPDELTQTGPVQWWQDALDGYQTLMAQGYESIIVAGVSMGGVFALKMALELPVKAVITMSAPMHAKSIGDLSQRIYDYAYNFKRIEGKSSELIEKELNQFKQKPKPFLTDLQQFIIEVKGKLVSITSLLVCCKVLKTNRCTFKVPKKFMIRYKQTTKN
ncbi:alpha/beta hydrolase [Piscibacillus salipiscarius]|uniref:alpha/beta hydrolase n=1 Tax=Piscibacillus salipiscarius TaxID=299480 RepID=UPI002436432D|nr:alpha/beta fold hydrolase [Piscibacillus salipiscarius]